MSHVRAVDGIFQCVRAFDDAEVIHVEGDVDPLRDMQIISTELRLKDIDWVEKALDGLKKTNRNLGTVSLADKAKKEEIATVEKILKLLQEDNKDVRKGTWTNKEASLFPHPHLHPEPDHYRMKKGPRSVKPSSSRGVTPNNNENIVLFLILPSPHPACYKKSSRCEANFQVEVINGLTLLTAKPITYLVNLSERDFVRKKNKWLPKIKAWIDENNPGDQLIPFSVALEERLVSMSDEEKIAEAETLGLPKGNPSALGKITTAGYASLDLIRYFTCGPDEVRAWTVRKGIKAPQAAGVIQ